jgi:GTP-binding protein HflX
MFERPASGEKVILVHVNLAQSGMSDDLEEFISLVTSAHVTPVNVLTANRRAPDAKYYIGTGKVEEVLEAITLYNADCIIFNNALSPSQQRNLEKKLCVAVLDRTQLILDIFALRARTHEGKLQVELAQLHHMSTRLVRGWTHLERQKGGIGMRGPGETQLETDRRLIRDRIKYVQKRLEKVRKQRMQGRQHRQRKPVPVVSLVGYTNAGKSTLFNLLTAADVYVADQLFATLDPTLRRIEIDGLGEIVLADTVGFIQHLPHDLIEAFRATLEETRDADLLLHVIDVSNEHYQAPVEAVDEVLREIGADKVPQVKVFNKIDSVPNLAPNKSEDAVWLSAAKDQGLDLLKDMLKQKLASQYIEKELTLGAAQGSVYAKLHQLKAILSEEDTEEGGWQLKIRMSEIEWQKLGL